MVTPNPYYQPTWNSRFLSQPDQAPQIKGRPVSSIEEVRATAIDFDGSVFYFPDLANKKIYTKQINYDGTNTINMYELKPIPMEPAINSTQYVTREEFAELAKKLEERLASMQQPSPQTPPQQPEKPAGQAQPQFNF